VAKIEDLRVSILDMTPDELREKIRFIREDRRISKVADKAPAKKREARAKNVSAMIKNMTAEQKAALLKELKG
jgi:hypothetical protein